MRFTILLFTLFFFVNVSGQTDIDSLTNEALLFTDEADITSFNDAVSELNHTLDTLKIHEEFNKIRQSASKTCNQPTGGDTNQTIKTC